VNLLPLIIPYLIKALANPATVALIWNILASVGQGNAAHAQPGSTPDPLLRYDVKWLQESLNTLLNKNSPVTGKYDDGTKADVIRYQKTKHPALVVDGWAGLNTIVSIVRDLETLKNKER
jgi:hypothetical protein